MFRRLERAARDVTPAMRKLRKDFRKEQRSHFRAEESSDGSRWPERTDETKRRQLRKAQRDAAARGKKNRPRRTRLLGKLRNFKIRYTKNSITAFSTAPWSGVQQAGGKVGHGAEIPAREFLWVNDKFVRDRAIPIIIAHVARRARRRR